MTDDARPAAAALHLPLIEEQLEIGKRRIETGRLRVRRHVEQRERLVDLPLQRDSLEVWRVPVEREVGAREPVRHEGDVTIVPLYEERLIVRKQLVLAAELHIRRQQSERHAPQRVWLRRETATVQRSARATGAEAAAAAANRQSAVAHGAGTPTAAQSSTPSTSSKGSNMASTLVAVFDDDNQARQACNRLQSAGIDDDAMQITSGTTADTGGTTGAHREGGIRGFFDRLFGRDDADDYSSHYSEAVRRGSAVLTVQLDDDSRADDITDILEDCGAIDVDERVRQWQAGGYTGYDAQAAPYTDAQRQAERDRLQTVQEDLKVGKRSVDRGGVRVYRSVSETPVEEDVTLREERAFVERTPVNRAAEPGELEEGLRDADFELRETGEEPVVQKSARVVEEVRAGTRADERTQTVRDKVRRSDVDVQRTGADGGSAYLGDDASLDERARSAAAQAAVGSYHGPERRRRAGSNPAGMERRATGF